MRSLFFLALLTSSFGMAAQNSNPATPTPSNSQKTDSAATPPPNSQPNPQLAPPRSDSVSADSLDDGPGESSSKDTQIDLSPPEDDAKKHPHSSDVLKDEGSGGNAGEVHPWDPHRAGKDIEVGDYYFRRKNYKGAEDRYREALFYKDNDAIATYRLAICLEKLDRRDEALVEYENYLRILPHGPQAADARKAIDRLKGASASVKPAK